MLGSTVISYLNIFINGFFAAGCMNVAFEYMRGKRMNSFAAYFAPLANGSMMFGLICLIILMWIATVIGFFLLIIPGLYLLVTFVFVIPLHIDRPNVGILKKLSLSVSIVNRGYCDIFGFCLCLVGVWIVGFICLLVFYCIYLSYILFSSALFLRRLFRIS